MTALPMLTAAEIQEGYALGRLTPLDTIETVIARYSAMQDDFSAFVAFDHEGARSQAAALMKKPDRDPRGPLWGIPIAIKDIIDVAGLPTTCHSAVHSHRPKDTDAYVITKLRDAGAIIIGKVSTHEFALGGPSFDLPYPPARNPWNRDYHPGGSSSGSAAAVAAGIVAVSIGTDSAGSIRFPAGACGIYGLKPTFGAVSRHGVFPLAPSMDVVGPLARSPQDLRIAYEAITDAPKSVRVGRTPTSKPLSHLRVGFVEHFHTKDLHADRETQTALEDTVKRLIDLGAAVEIVQLPPLQAYLAVNRITLYAEAWSIHASWLRERPQDYGAAARKSLMIGAFIPVDAYLHAQRQRRKLFEAVEQSLQKVDVLLTANTLDVTCRIDDEQSLQRTVPRQARAVFSVTGHPALSTPAGIAENGLPMSAQFAAPLGREDLLFSIADAFGLAPLPA